MRSAIVYLHSDDPLTVPLMAGWCGHRAGAEGVKVTKVVTDPDGLLPPGERPGWQEVVELAAGGDVVMVVTLDRVSLAPDRKSWDELVADLAKVGTVLITHRTPIPVLPPTAEAPQLVPVPALPPTVEARQLAPVPVAPPAEELVGAGSQR